MKTPKELDFPTILKAGYGYHMGYIFRRAESDIPVTILAFIDHKYGWRFRLPDGQRAYTVAKAFTALPEVKPMGLPK